jgi:hypothetical protein
MKQRGPISQINMRLPESLHPRIKARAAERGITAESAYEEGMTAWLSSTDSAGGVNTPGIGGSDSAAILLKPEIGNEILETLQEILSVLRRLTIQVDAITETSGAPPGREGKPPYVEDELSPPLGSRRGRTADTEGRRMRS